MKHNFISFIIPGKCPDDLKVTTFYSFIILELSFELIELTDLGGVPILPLVVIV